MNESLKFVDLSGVKSEEKGEQEHMTWCGGDRHCGFYVSVI